MTERNIESIEDYFSRVWKRTTANFLESDMDLDVAMNKAVEETNSDVALTIQKRLIDEFAKMLKG